MYTKGQVELAVTTIVVYTSDYEGSRKVLLEGIAAACHQQNRVYCLSLGDESQIPWSEAPDWQKQSVVEGVKSALLNPDPAASHQGWLAHKRAAGWAWGAVKDPEKKLHPCMVEYKDLPEDQKRKDLFFVETVQELGLTLGLIRLTNLSSKPPS